MKKVFFSLFVITYLISSNSLYSFEETCSFCKNSSFFYGKTGEVRDSFKELVERLNLRDYLAPEFKFIEGIEIYSGQIDRWNEEDFPDINISWTGVYKKCAFEHFWTIPSWAIPGENKYDIILRRENFYFTNYFDCKRAFFAITDDINKIYEVEVNHIDRRIEDYKKHIKLIKKYEDDYYSLFDTAAGRSKPFPLLVKETLDAIKDEKKQIETLKRFIVDKGL